MPQARVLTRNRVIPFRLRGGRRRLVACSVCLRVQDGRAWLDADEVIRRLRTFDCDDVVRLRGAVCERCRTYLGHRRESGSKWARRLGVKWTRRRPG